MAAVSRIFNRFVPQVLHMIVLPIFFFVFMLIYRPFGVSDYFGNEWFAVHLTMFSCIVLLSVILTRMVYYYLRMQINYILYACWCIGESLFASLMAALYLWLVIYPDLPYLEVVSTAFKYTALVLAIPYTIIALAMVIYEYRNATASNEESQKRIRFYDSKHNLKIVLTPDSILYIAAEINYVTITYTDNGKEKNYTLRTSMKSIDEICQENGLVRCHRSYYINPSYVKVLRKDKEGVILAEIESTNNIRIPVSKTYYNHLAELLY
jgi:hypothetical protein